MNSSRLYLPYLDEWDAQSARRCFDKGDGEGFGCCGYSKGIMLDMVLWNQAQLIGRGIYEAALLSAFTGCKHNNRHLNPDTIEAMFRRADRAKLVTAGDPLPGPGPFTIYRGVSGRTTARRVRGLSWTDDLDRACWFAMRYPGHDPAVYTATVTADEVFSFENDRNEREFIVRPAKCKRMPLTLNELQAAEDRVVKAQHERDKKWLAEVQAKHAKQGIVEGEAA